MAWPTEAGSVAFVRSSKLKKPADAPRSRIFPPLFGAAFASGFDVLRLYGSGAASDGGAQADPNANFGNYRSSTELATLGVQGAVERIGMARLSPGHEPGVGAVESDGASSLRYTAPESSTPGPYIQVPYGTAILYDGEDASKGLRVTRASGAAFPVQGKRELLLVDQYNNAFGFDNVSHAERNAGDDEYRAVFLKNAGLRVLTVRAFMTPLGTQRTVSVAGYAAAGAVSIAPTSGDFKDWPASGFVENQDTGEVLYYSSRTSSALAVPAGGRDVYAEVGGGAAGSSGDAIYPISGLRIAKEAPSAQPSGFVQTIADEDTVPAGLTFRHPISAADAQVVTFTLNPGEIYGLWLHRAIVAGATAAALVRNFITVEADPLGASTITALLRGLYRMADNALEQYELFRGVDAEADLTGAAWETFTSLPHLTAALAVGHTYNFVLRKRNVHNLSSQNISKTTVVVDGGGAEANYPSDPSEQTLAAAAAGAARVTAQYDYLPDAAAIRADTWAVWITSDGSTPNTAAAATYTEAMVFVDGIAKLDYTDGGHADLATLKAIVRARRSGTPDVDSQNSDIQTVTADASGPAAPTGGAFFGGAEEQK